MVIKWDKNKEALDSLFESIGGTPLVRLRKIPKAEGVDANILVKLEYVNPTGSLKDRIYLEMITKAIEAGDLKPGMEIIEASTGNAGIACTFIGKILGYKVTIVIPAGMSQERMKIIRAYGGDIIFTPGAESDVDLCLKKIDELKKEKPGMEIIEASTGNAGIACTFIGKILGYKVTIVIPAGMSKERMKIIRAYGGDIIFTPGAESDVDLCLKKIDELKKENPGKYWWPNQYNNPNNPMAHYKSTGPEIWQQAKGKVDCFLASQGTGGTLTGVGRFLREKNPNIALYAVEPSEAPMLSKREWGSHKVEGIGDGFVPFNLDLSLLKGIVTTTSEEAINMAKRLALEEGIFCGISSGCNVAAIVKVARRHPEFETIVTMINDTGQRYLSTELCGELKTVDIPERTHPLDEYTIRELDKYQASWEVIE